MKTLFKWVGVLGCGLYLLNPTFGVFEIFPDNLPFIGNLDEGAAGSCLVLLLQSLRKQKRLKPIQEDQQMPDEPT